MTLCARGEDVTIGVLGDWGVAAISPTQAGVEAQIAGLVKSWNPDIIFTLGDNNYYRGEAGTIDFNIGQFYHEYIYPYGGAYGAGASSNRFFPSLGNHDYFCCTNDSPDPYLDYFALPGNERYYNYRYGPVELFAVNSEFQEPDGYTNGSVQAQWLQAQLAASTAQWKLVYFHRAPYCSGGYGNIPSMQWPFAQWGASAVLAGHSHVYERIHTNGIPYFVNGLSGAPIYGMGPPIPGSQSRFNADYGAMRIDASETAITFRFITRGDVLIDQLSIVNTNAPGSPHIIQSPSFLAVRPGSNATFRVEAVGYGTLSYQWLFNGDPVPNATNNSLTLLNIDPDDEGYYAVRVSNEVGSVLSESGFLAVIFRPVVISQPQSQTVKSGLSATFTVVADGDPPLRYQWRFEGTPLPDRTNAVLTLTNVQGTHSGNYSVVISNAHGFTISSNAFLTVIIRPAFTLHPLNQTVVSGGDATFSVAASGNAPISYQWRRNGLLFTNIILNQNTCYFTLRNVSAALSGTWRVGLTNLAGPALGGQSSNAVLTVLADGDADGAPDVWETQNGFDPAVAADGLLDPDGDGASNAAEFASGTDPHDPESCLRVIPVVGSAQSLLLSFQALSNRTYAVESRPGWAAHWQTMSEITAMPSNRLLGLSLPLDNKLRVYRVTTPFIFIPPPED
jgi:tartrate-resistant acid phosphatase type 5